MTPDYTIVGAAAILLLVLVLFGLVFGLGYYIAKFMDKTR